jgi:lysophospholipase L1-like esterase
MIVAALFAGALALGLDPALGLGPHVWCIGDSITHFYVPALRRLEPTWTITNYGRGGERSDRGLVRLSALLATRPAPDVVILLWGANDVGARVLAGDTRYGPAQAAANLREMALQVRLAGAIPIVALPIGAPPPRAEDPPKDRANLRALRRGFARLRRLLRTQAPRADLRLGRRHLFLDALHPRPAGVQVIAQRAAAAVRRALRSRASCPADRGARAPRPGRTRPPA